MKSSVIVKIFLLVGALLVMLGIIFPYMISSTSTELVIGGILAMFGLGMWGAVTVNNLLKGESQ